MKHRFASIVAAVVATAGCGCVSPGWRERSAPGPGAPAGLAGGGVRIREIQGKAHRSPRVGQVVVAVRGIATAVRSNGFFLQDPLPDGDPETSEALFVFTSSQPEVAAGDALQVTGPVSEYRPGCADCGPGASAFANLTTTQIDRPTDLRVLSSGNPLPPPVAIGPAPGERHPPGAVIDDDTEGDVEIGPTVFDPDRDGLDFYESLESMRVVLTDAVVVGPTFDFGGNPPARELPVLARGGQGAGLRSPRGGVVVAPGDFNPERVIVSSALVDLPEAQVGDRLPGPITGVLDYSFGNFKLLASEPLPPIQPGGLTRASLRFGPPAATELTFATLNVENLAAADDAGKFAALAEIVVGHLAAPDLVALEEVQDDNGPRNDAVVTAGATLQRLTGAIAAAGGPAYQSRGVDPADDQDGGEPGGNIRVVILFRSDRGLAFVDRPGATAARPNRVLSAGGVPRLELSPGRLDPGNPAFRNSRKPLAAELTFAGQTLFVVANHFNSRGGDQPLFGRFQPPRLTSEPQRLQQVEVVASFVEEILALDATARILVMGDLNDFPSSPPLARLGQACLTALVETLPPAERYSYVFEGNSQALDHILVSPALAGAAYDIVHVNAELAVQASDHDPTAARFTIAP